MEKQLAIGIITYLRPRMLKRLLQSLEVMRTPKGYHTTIIIVDNDEEESAKEIVDEFISDSKLEILYEVEPRQGVSYARNRVVEMAIAIDIELLYFIDDDERLPYDSLTTLLDFFESHECEIATGPVVSVYPDKTPRWIVDGNFHNWQNFEDGAPRPVAATNNTLFDMSVFLEYGLHFDEKWALSGGEDQHLTGMLVRRGGTIRWCSNAFVYEDIPMNRCTMAWLIRRQFRISTTVSSIDRQEKGWLQAASKVLRVCFGCMLKAPFHFCLYVLVWQKKHALLGFRNLAKGLGAVFGLFGYLQEEYKTIHGE